MLNEWSLVQLCPDNKINQTFNSREIDIHCYCSASNPLFCKHPYRTDNVAQIQRERKTGQYNWIDTGWLLFSWVYIFWQQGSQALIWLYLIGYDTKYKEHSNAWMSDCYSRGIAPLPLINQISSCLAALSITNILP